MLRERHIHNCHTNKGAYTISTSIGPELIQNHWLTTWPPHMLITACSGHSRFSSHTSVPALAPFAVSDSKQGGAGIN